MPIYEFRCAACGHVQEVLTRGASDPVDMKCKECGGEEMERVLSQVSYSMGSPGSSRDSGPAATTRTCAPGQSCTSITLPGHSKD
jgi:putative FmdB family regulatory protein